MLRKSSTGIHAILGSVHAHKHAVQVVSCVLVASPSASAASMGGRPIDIGHRAAGRRLRLSLSASVDGGQRRRPSKRRQGNARVNACTYSPTPFQAICSGGERGHVLPHPSYHVGGGVSARGSALGTRRTGGSRDTHGTHGTPTGKKTQDVPVTED